MILVLDLGNTNLYVGVFDKDKLVCTFRKHTAYISSDEYLEVFDSLFKINHIDVSQIEGSILSSVIPSLTIEVAKGIEKLTKKPCLILGKGTKTNLNIKTDNPSELGSDLVADSVGAIKKYHYPLIIADLGTCNKLLVIDDKGSFIGCTISLGIRKEMKALTSNAAQLMDVNLQSPKKLIGKNSMDAINSGILNGDAFMISGLSSKIEEELGYKCKKILTGGCSVLIKDLLDDFIYDESLILEGLKEIYLKNINNINQ